MEGRIFWSQTWPECISTALKDCGFLEAASEEIKKYKKEYKKFYILDAKGKCWRLSESEENNFWVLLTNDQREAFSSNTSNTESGFPVQFVAAKKRRKNTKFYWAHNVVPI